MGFRCFICHYDKYGKRTVNYIVTLMGLSPNEYLDGLAVIKSRNSHVRTYPPAELCTYPSSRFSTYYVFVPSVPKFVVYHPKHGCGVRHEEYHHCNARYDGHGNSHHQWRQFSDGPSLLFSCRIRYLACVRQNARRYKDPTKRDTPFPSPQVL